MQGKGKGTKGKVTKQELINLDGSDNDADFDIGNDDEDREVSEQATKHFEALRKTLKSCQKCGPDVMCKINFHGNHVKVSFNLLRPWVKALVSDLYFNQ